MSLTHLMDMPNLPLLIEKAQQQLEAEKVLRQHFYSIIDENTKMEFINGEIVFQSPVTMRQNSTTGNLYSLMATYAEINDLGWVGIEKVLVSLTRNDYEPDVCFWKKERADLFTDDQMQFPEPDLAVEVLSPKTAKTDRTTKYIDYEAHGVKEYWLVDPKKQTVEQYVLINGQYYARFKGRDGEIESEVLPGFLLEAEAIFDQKATNEALMKLLS